MLDHFPDECPELVHLGTCVAAAVGNRTGTAFLVGFIREPFNLVLGSL